MTGEHRDWQGMYPAAESRWQDLARIVKFILPIVFVIFFLVIVMVGYIFIYYDDWYPASIPQPSTNLIVFRLLMLVLPVIAIIIIGVGYIYRQTKSLIIDFYGPKVDEKLMPLIRRKLHGIPPLPPILDSFINYPFIVLRELSLEEDHWARWFGGPAIFVVYDGAAVYLERGNKFSRVVGPGFPSLERHERVRDVVDLRPQTKTGETSPWSKDGIRVRLTVRADIQIHASQEAIRNSFKLRYPFDPIAVKKAVEYSSVRLVDGILKESTWIDGAWGAIIGEVNKFVAGHSLDELFLAPEIENYLNSHHQDEPTIESIEQILSSEISKQVIDKIRNSLQKNGINLRNLQIIDVDVPKEVRDIREKYWEGIKKIIAAKRDSRAEADRIRTREQAHADAQRTMLKAIINRLSGDSENPKKLTEHLALSLSGILDQGIDDPIIRPLIAKEAFGVLERIKKLLDDGF